MADRLYLDHNATSPLRPIVREAMLEVMDAPHNASSVHAEGRQAKAVLERSRKMIARALSAPSEGLIFTGGGTEADNLAVLGLIGGTKTIRTLFITATEHSAVKAAAALFRESGGRVEAIPVGADGLVDLEWLAARIKGFDPSTEGGFAVCVMLANNETGVVQPVERIGPLVWPKGGYVIVDAVQGVGKLPINFDDLGADVMTIAAHKIGGPVGVGAILTKPGIVIAPQIVGGGQEQYRRAGTENIAGIVGLAKTIEVASPDEYATLAGERDAIEAGLPQGTVIWGKEAPRLANTLCFSTPGFSSETQVMVMDLAGIAVSAGSACSSGKVRQSSVLRAMSANESEAGSALRVSLGWDTPAGASAHFLKAWSKEYERISQQATTNDRPQHTHHTNNTAA